jgi:hypothetical protein
MASKTTKHTGHANPAAHRAVIERARSSAGLPHDPRPNRERTRADIERAARKGWD